MIAVAEVEEVTGFLVADISDSVLTLFLNIILVELIYIYIYFSCHITWLAGSFSVTRVGRECGPESGVSVDQRRA